MTLISKDIFRWGTMVKQLKITNRCYNDVKKEGKFHISPAKIKEWLMKQDACTLHKPIQRHFKRNSVIVGGIDQQWQKDLADM